MTIFKEFSFLRLEVYFCAISKSKFFMKEMKIQEERTINKKHIGAVVLEWIKTYFKLFSFKLKNLAG